MELKNTKNTSLFQYICVLSAFFPSSYQFKHQTWRSYLGQYNDNFLLFLALFYPEKIDNTCTKPRLKRVADKYPLKNQKTREAEVAATVLRLHTLFMFL